MTKPIQLITKIPFEGFYDSIWSHEIDREEEQFGEYEANERDEGERQFPEELRLSESEIAEILFYVTDYPAAYRSIAAEYVDAFAYQASELLGVKLELTFESMVSPREYNFETDRLFAFVPLKVMRELFKRSKADDHRTLAAVVRERFTSCDGFASFYENDLAPWLAKPLTAWDHNELETLLIAAMQLAGADPRDDEEFRESIYYAVTEDSGCYGAWSNAVDWLKYEERRADARQDKLDDWREANPDLAADVEAIPVRCDRTLDMFADASRCPGAPS